MPVILAALLTGLRFLFVRLLGWLIANGGAIVANVLVALGFYFVAAKPISNQFKNYIQTKFAGAPGTVIETLYYLNVDDYITMILSAYAAVSAMTAGKAIMLRRNLTTTPGSGG